MTQQVEESPVTTTFADTTTVEGTTTSAPVTVSLNSDAYEETGQDFVLVLNGHIGGSNTLSDKPVDLTYTITIYVAPGVSVS